MNNNSKIVIYEELEPLLLKIEMLVLIILVQIFSNLAKEFHHTNTINQIDLCFSRYISYATLNHKSLDHILMELLITNSQVIYQYYLSISLDHFQMSTVVDPILMTIFNLFYCYFTSIVILFHYHLNYFMNYNLCFEEDRQWIKINQMD